MAGSPGRPGSAAKLTLNQLKAPAVGRPVNKYYTDHSHKAEIDLCEIHLHIILNPISY